MNLTKSFVGDLRQYKHKAVCPLGGVDSLNPCRWRGKRLHHYGGDVCCVFVLCITISLVVCKKVPEHNLKVHILPYCKVNMHYFFGPPMCAPCPEQGTCEDD